MTSVEMLFLLLTLMNTDIGISNVGKNQEQEERQERIEKKLDELLKWIQSDRTP